MIIVQAKRVPAAPNVLFSALVQGPQASFDPSISSESGSAYGGPVSWDFGDGSPIDNNAIPAAHNYATAGPFTAIATTTAPIQGNRITATSDDLLSVSVIGNSLSDRLLLASNPNLASITYAADHSALKNIDLTGTALTEAPPVAAMPNLILLHLDSITSMPAAELDGIDWGLLLSLTDLRLTGTAITDLDMSAPRATGLTIQIRNCVNWVTADFSGVSGPLTLLANGSTSIGPALEAAILGANLVRLDADDTGLPATFDLSGQGNLTVADLFTNPLLSSLTLPSPSSMQTLRASGTNLSSIANLAQQSSISTLQINGGNFNAAQLDVVLGDLVASGAVGGSLDYSNQPGGAHEDVNRGVGAGFAPGEHLDVLINTRGWTRTGSGY